MEEFLLSAVECTWGEWCYTDRNIYSLAFGPESSTFETEIVIAKLKKHNLPGSDPIQAGGETLHSEIHKLINSIWNK
jgi:hypothetical protein